MNNKLIDEAIKMRKRSYAPYSKYHVGAAVETESGDIIGSDLVRELKTRVGNIHFMGIGGTRMRQLGFESLYDIDLLSIRGYVEVLKSLPKLLFLRKTF